MQMSNEEEDGLLSPLHSFLNLFIYLFIFLGNRTDLLKQMT